MAQVKAKTRGYVGGQIRETGEVFEWPEGVPLGEWVAPARFGGKGDHDGDGKVGGSVPSAPAGDVEVPENWRKMSAAERRALAKALTGEEHSNAKDADAAIELHVEAKGKPEDGTVRNELASASGPAPDWVSPAHDGKPVMATE